MRAAKCLAALFVLGFSWIASGSTNLIVNGSFDAPDDPLQGWLVDYKFDGVSHYMQNDKRVSVVPQEAGRSQVLYLDGCTEPGTRAESSLIPFDPKGRYRATLYVKGGPYRIQFRGYQWRPGVRPHPNPKPEDLRQVYRSKEALASPGDHYVVYRNGTVKGANNPWRKLEFEIPGKAATELSLKSMNKVRFIRVYVYTWNGDAGVYERSKLYVDDVFVERLE